MRARRRPGPGAGSPTRGPQRDRRGRGLRGELAPRAVPRQRTRSEQFDEMVLDAVDQLEGHWAAEIAPLEFAVEDVPALPVTEFDPEVIVDRGVPLGRLLRAGTAGATDPTIVIYRRPVEARAAAGDERADLIFMVVAELVAEFLGRDIDDLDPPHPGR